MPNRYLERRRQRDQRNPYGSRGGYVDSRRGGRDYRGMDRAMDNRYNDSEYSRGYDGRDYHEYRREGYHSGGERFREHPRTMGYEMYGVGGIRPRDSRDYNDYNDYNDYRDYGRDYNDYNDYASGGEEKYHEDLKEWCKKLKKYDKFNMPKEEILTQARQMGVKFDEFNEEEFLCTYYMMMSDYKMEMLNSPQAYMVMAKSFLNDQDSELKGSEKLCAYMYEIVKGGKE